MLRVRSVLNTHETELDSPPAKTSFKYLSALPFVVKKIGSCYDTERLQKCANYWCNKTLHFFRFFFLSFFLSFFFFFSFFSTTGALQTEVPKAANFPQVLSTVPPPTVSFLSPFFLFFVFKFRQLFPQHRLLRTHLGFYPLLSKHCQLWNIIGAGKHNSTPK